VSLGLPSVERKKRVARALGNPIYFGEVYVRPYDANWTAPLPRFAYEMAQFALGVRRGVIIMPPEYLKTTLVSQVIPLFLTVSETVQGKLLRGMLLSEEEDMAKNNLSVIKWHIENNDYIRADFCDEQGRALIYPDPDEATWRDDAIIV